MDIGTLIIGALLGGIPSWFISKYFANKSSKELASSLKNQTNQLNSKATLANFEKMLRSNEWVKEHEGHNAIWVCEKNRLFQMHIGDDDRKFCEKWTKVFPDQYTTMFHIDLKVQGTIINSLPFISADGGRYTLPLPELIVVDDEPSFYWDPSSIEYKIAETIGNFYHYDSLEQVAGFTNIELHSVSKIA